MDAAAKLWRVCLDDAEAGSGFLSLSPGEAAHRADLKLAEVVPASDLLARLGVLLSCPALPGAVPFKLNPSPPSWAADGAVWPYPARLRDLLLAHSAE
jgi:hypothetical protein